MIGWDNSVIPPFLFLYFAHMGHRRRRDVIASGTQSQTAQRPRGTEPYSAMHERFAHATSSDRDSGFVLARASDRTWPAALVTVGAAVLASATRLNPFWMLLAGGILGFAGVIG